VAIALAFARLAAMAAATLLFFVWGVATTGIVAKTSGLGQTFSTCFLATLSRVSSIALPRSGQMASKTQKTLRAVSRTPAFGSARAFLRHLSRISIPPAASTACFDRVQ